MVMIKEHNKKYGWKNWGGSFGPPLLVKLGLTFLWDRDKNEITWYNICFYDWEFDECSGYSISLYFSFLFARYKCYMCVSDFCVFLHFRHFFRAFWVENWLRYDNLCHMNVFGWLLYTAKMWRKFCQFLRKIWFFY